ncbi:metallophosphoesterase, partial [Candidatus Woesearchaeota archaeon]|nr:metallophosphoesterase [Candidatus Woesearchaeota archaeon]
MVYAVISDIHSNKEATEAVLEDISEKGITEIFCIGDIVGYGADPAACCALTSKYCKSVMGNHDAYLVNIFFHNLKKESKGLISWWRQKRNPVDQQRDFGSLFRGPPTPLAYATVLAHNADLQDKHKRFLANLPLEIITENAILSHQSPGTDAYDYKRQEKGQELASYADYVVTAKDYFSEEAETIEKNGLVHTVLQYKHARPGAYALAAVQLLGKDVGIMGHSHLANFIAYPKNEKINTDKIQAVIITKNLQRSGRKNAKSAFELPLHPEFVYLLNPGSVGQPRDHDPRASYMIVYENRVVWCKIPYPANEAFD